MVADHHKSRAMLISRQCEQGTRREYSPASTRGHLRASTRGEYSRQCEIALRLCIDDDDYRKRSSTFLEKKCTPTEKSWLRL